MADLEGAQAQRGACQPTPHPGGFDNAQCVRSNGQWAFCRPSSRCPIHCTERIAVLFVNGAGKRGEK